MLLSVCIITYNEEKFIRECVRSVQQIADEIIVMDAFSTDSTLEICESEGCIVFKSEWENDYAIARNKAIDKAKGEWILFLDADEELVNPRPLLKRIQKQVSSRVGGFILERTDIFRNKDSGKIYRYPVGIVRLFRNLPSFRFSSPIHEEINTSIYLSNYCLSVHTTSKIKHRVNESTDQFLAQKQKQYLALLEVEIQKDNSNWWAIYHRAKTLWFFDRKEEALIDFLQVAESKDAREDLKVSSYANASLLAIDVKKESVHLFLNSAIKINENAFILKYAQAESLYKEGKFISALRIYAQIPVSLKASRKGAAIPGGVYLRPEMKIYKIGCCLYALEKLKLAKIVFSIGQHLYSFDPINLFGKSVVHARLKKKSKAIDGFKKCLEIEPNWNAPSDELKRMAIHI